MGSNFSEFTLPTGKATLLATLPQIKKVQTEEQPKPQNPQPFTGNGKKGVLGQNVPNPVTGTTTISYEIYTEGAGRNPDL